MDSIAHGGRRVRTTFAADHCSVGEDLLPELEAEHAGRKLANRTCRECIDGNVVAARSSFSKTITDQVWSSKRLPDRCSHASGGHSASRFASAATASQQASGCTRDMAAKLPKPSSSGCAGRADVHFCS